MEALRIGQMMLSVRFRGWSSCWRRQLADDSGTVGNCPEGPSPSVASSATAVIANAVVRLQTRRLSTDWSLISELLWEHRDHAALIDGLWSRGVCFGIFLATIF